MVDSAFFYQKSCQLLSYKLETCTRFFFQIVLLKPLEVWLRLGQFVVRPH